MTQRRPSQRSSTLGLPDLSGTENPLLNSPAFATNPNSLERGVIIAVDANNHTYRVQTSSGRVQYMSRLRSHPGDLALLPVHTQVVVSYGLGLPLIMGMIPDAGRPPTSEEPESLTGTSGHGGEDPILSRGVAPSARMADEPRDQLPGDAVLRSPDGSSLGALRGRVAQLKGSDVAKIEAFGGTDMVRVVAGVFQMLTWMGESKIVNDQGKTSLIWDGGADQLTQTGQDEAQYTLHLKLGHEGNLARFSVTNREGQEKFYAHVAPDGTVDVFARGGIRAHYGNDSEDRHSQAYIGNLRQEIVGDRESSVEGDDVTTINGTVQQNYSENVNCYVGGTRFCQVTQDVRDTVGGEMTTVCTGNYSVFTSSDFTQEVLGGGFYDVKTAGGPYRVDSRGGLCRFRTGRGDFEVISGGVIKLKAGANSVQLGNNPTSHATKFEELNTAIQGLVTELNAMRALLVSHVHPQVGPVPGNTGPAPTLAPVANPLVVALAPAQSTTTTVE